MEKGTPNLDIFQYGDYRTFLADFYHREKDGSPGFSYRAFARRAGLASPNYLKLVIDGARPVTEKNLSAFLRGLKLGSAEADYFRTLVSMKESRDDKEKVSLLERMLRLRMRHSGDPLQVDKDRWEILRSWHHWAIREMVLLEDFRAEPAWIASRLGRKITPAQARESLELLQRLQFLKPDPVTGALRQSDAMITTADEISNLIIRHIHRQFIELGLVSLFHDPVGVREMNGVTLALRTDQIPVFKKMLKDFRRELNRQFSGASSTGADHPRATGADHVYHLEMMFFPVTKTGELNPLEEGFSGVQQ
jgi:uncharacterized protein (TIGR02147 family)